MTEPEGMPKDKAELMARLEREWLALLHTIEGLSEAQMAQPDAGGWSIKDNLAHLSEWERFLVRSQFQGLPAHQALQVEPAVLERFDENRMNAILLERNRGRTAPDVLADLHRTHAQLVAALEQASDGDLAKPTSLITPEVNPVMVWTTYNTYEHYAEHRKTIQAAAERQRLAFS